MTLARLSYRILFLVFAAIFLRACVFEIVRVNDNAMAPAVKKGDLVLINKLAYGIRMPGAGSYLFFWRSPLPGDLLMAVEWGDPPINVIRRVAKLPKEIVKVTGQENHLLLDGEYALGILQDDESLTLYHGPARLRNVAGRARYILLPRDLRTDSLLSALIRPIQ